MRTPLLKEPLEIKENYFDETYREFIKLYQDKDNRIKLFGKNIYIEFRSIFDKKAEGFWHISSIENTEKYDMTPCTNEESYGKCNYRYYCEDRENLVYHREIIDLGRIPCIYRSRRIHWIEELIKFANFKSDKVNVWEEKDLKSGKIKLKIRMVDENTDYIVIFMKNYRGEEVYYKLITAFPVVYKLNKKRYDKQYEKFCSENKKSRSEP